MQFDQVKSQAVTTGGKEEASWRSSIAVLLARGSGEPPRELSLEVAPLMGGLVSGSVQSVRARYRDRYGAPLTTELVIKQLDGPARREAGVYQALMRTSMRRLAPALLAVEPGVDGTVQLFIQQIAPKNIWPWQDEAAASSVLRALAALHESRAASALTAHVNDWDYEQELRARAAGLVECLERHGPALREAGVPLRMTLVRRLARRLSGLRQGLVSHAALPATVIHGDVHPGNVMIQEPALQEPGAGAHQPILLDWARARLGSPLEDVSSWLQSLGYWEPVARRRHDSLLGEYLRARGLDACPTRELRAAYWVAAASNCFAGSLQYHIGVATSSEIGRDAREAAFAAVRDQLRILRRADACAS